MRSTTARPSSTSDRVLGAAGILGGTVLLAAFVVGVPREVNDVRLTLYVLGAVAVVIAVHRRQVAASPKLARIVAIAAIAANVMFLLRGVILPNGPWHPFAGDHGSVLFYASVAMWLTDAAFGFVALRLGAVTRWGAMALGVGSLLAILGMNQPVSDITVFGRLGLTGVALNGITWILLGLDVMLGGAAVFVLQLHSDDGAAVFPEEPAALGGDFLVEGADAFEVGGVVAELGPTVAGSETAVVQGVGDLRPAL
jgi:hypothetical protein